MKYTKNQVHHTGYFKLENAKIKCRYIEERVLLQRGGGGTDTYLIYKDFFFQLGKHTKEPIQGPWTMTK